MRKSIYGRRFKRDTNERKALFRTLMREMILRGQITTTEAKAKAIKPELEKSVTKALKSKEASYHLQKTFISKEISDRLILEIAPKFKDRPGGYTRIIKVGNRVKDNAPMVVLEWVERVDAVPTKVKRSQKKVTTASSNKPSQVQKEAPKQMKKVTPKAPSARKVTQRKAMQSSKGK